MKLTKEQIDYLKKCNNICFRHCYHKHGQIEAYRTSDNHDMRRIEIESQSTIDGKAFVSCGVYDTLKYVLSKLTTSDEISLFWYGNYGNNQYTKDTNLVSDALLLVVNNERILIQKQICADNSARMIQKKDDVF